MTDIVFGGVLGLGVWAYVSSKQYSFLLEKLDYFQNSFEDAEKNLKLGISKGSSIEILQGISKAKVPKYHMFVDPFRYFSLKKEFSKMNNKAKKRLEDFDLA